MNAKNTFYNTLILSLIVQVITGIIEIGTLFANIKINLLKQLLILEVSVQAIEGLFYFWIFNNFNQVTNVTPKRYIDWGLTTPTMLIELILYLIYLKDKENGADVTKLSFFNLLIENSSNISYILSLNWLMLIFGYLGEINILDTITAVIFGFIPFLIYYFIIYVNYSNKSKSGWKLFWYFFFNVSL